MNGLPEPDHEYGFTKPYLIHTLIKRNCLPELFFAWIIGQTAGQLPDGTTIYYTADVYNYLINGGFFAEVAD